MVNASSFKQTGKVTALNSGCMKVCQLPCRLRIGRYSDMRTSQRTSSSMTYHRQRSEKHLATDNTSEEQPSDVDVVVDDRLRKSDSPCQVLHLVVVHQRLLHWSIRMGGEACRTQQTEELEDCLDKEDERHLYNDFLCTVESED